MDGCCQDVAFDAFGTFCPQLTHLLIDVTVFPIKTLSNLEMHIPNLSCITLKAPLLHGLPTRAAAYVGTALCALQSVKSLVTMVLDFDDSNYLQCSEGCWEQVPENLRELFSLCEIHSIEDATFLLGKLHTLSMPSPDEQVDVFDILSNAPHLQKLSISSQVPLSLYLDSVEDVTAGVQLLSQRLLAGFQLLAPALQLTGTSPIVQAILSAMPALPGVHHLTVENEDITVPFSFLHVARVFPCLTELHFHLWNCHLGIPQLNIEQLECLAGCSCLVHLRMHATLDITSLQLAGLCASMPGLKLLGFIESEGVSVEQLEVHLAAQGQAVVVEQF